MKKLLAAVAVLVVSTTQADTIYVDDDAPLGGDGLSWETAYRFLQDALANAVAGTEIRVGQGVYKPDQDEAGGVTPGDRTATFQLLGGVALMGGYAGTDAPDPDERDIARYETILSGDLLGDDAPDFQNNDENSYHVLLGDITAGTAVLNGVAVNGGNADGNQDQARGGALYSTTGDFAITDCTFNGNAAISFGGGLFVQGTTTQISNCTFDGNAGGRGGAMSIGGSVTLSDCIFVGSPSGGAVRHGGTLIAIRCEFVGNTAGVHDQRHGGGVANYGDALYVACRFAGNSASGRGGGLYVFTGDVTIVNSLFHDNQGHLGGAAMLYSDTTRFFNCTLSQNTAADGGGLYSSGGFAELVNTIVWANTATSCDQIRPWELAPPVVAYCDIQGGWPGIGNIDSDPLFVDAAAGDYRLSLGSACLEGGRCVDLPTDDLDLDGNERVINTAIDMGPYEFQAPPIPPGDLDRDSIVGVSDFILLLAGWGPCCRGDLNSDGTIDQDDLNLLLKILGPCPKAGPCPGDLDDDGDIDPDDALRLVDGFGGCAPCSNVPDATLSNLVERCPGDVNQDGVTDIADFLTLLTNWD